MKLNITVFYLLQYIYFNYCEYYAIVSFKLDRKFISFISFGVEFGLFYSFFLCILANVLFDFSIRLLQKNVAKIGRRDIENQIISLCCAFCSILVVFIVESIR